MLSCPPGCRKAWVQKGLRRFGRSAINIEVGGCGGAKACHKKQRRKRVTPRKPPKEPPVEPPGKTANQPPLRLETSPPQGAVVFSLDPVPVKVKTRERRPADGESLAGQDEVGETPGTVVDDAPACQGRQPHPEVVHAEPPQEHGGIRVLGEASGGCFLPEPFCTRGARQLCCWGEGGAANRGAPHSAGKVHPHTASR